MITLSAAPFIRILPAFCLGVVTNHFDLLNAFPVVVILFSSFIIILYLSWAAKPDFAFRCRVGFCFQFLFFSFGFLLCESKDLRNSKTYFERYESVRLYSAVVNEVAVQKGDRIRTVVNLKSVLVQQSLYPVTGKVYAYFRKDTLALKLMPGDEITFKSTPQGLAHPENPGQFDFKNYSSKRRIFHQVWLKNDEWKKIKSHSPFSIKAAASNFRNEFLGIYKRAGLSGQEYAVLSALVFGYDDEIDRTVFNAFSASGTLHILSVSGMHVGIIFGALSLLLRYFEKRKYTGFIRLVFLLITLWVYACITGLSSSVIRSTMMFSFILTGNFLNRTGNIYNTLALSAFSIFLFFDPLMIFEIGLQLSFLAVAGIVFFYPRIYKLFEIRNWLLDKMWTLTSVSIAAQLATFPITLYYFHQFPNYFILANLLIIPLSTAGIFAGIILLIISPIEIIILKAGKIIEILIRLLNESALFIESIPGSVFTDLFISAVDMLLIYVLIFMIVSFLETKAYKYLQGICVIILLLLASLIYSEMEMHDKRKLVIFSGTKDLCIQLLNGRNSLLFSSEADSSKAIVLSNAYNAQEKLKAENRRIILFHDFFGSDSSSKNIIFRTSKYVLIDTLLIYRWSGQEVNRVEPSTDFIYSSILPKDGHKFPLLKSVEWLINKKYLSPSEKEIIEQSGRSVHLLHKSAKEIEL